MSGAHSPESGRPRRRALLALTAAVALSVGSVVAVTAPARAATRSDPLAYVAVPGGMGGGEIDVIDTATDTVATTIPTSVAGDSEDLVLNSSGSVAYDAAGPTLRVLNTVTDGLTATVNLPGGGLTENLVLSPDGSVAYVGNFYGSVDVFDTATDTFGTIITLPDDLDSLTLSPDGNRLYATTYGGTVSVIDTATDTVSGELPIMGCRCTVAFNPTGTLAYVANENDDTVSVLDTATDAVTATVPVGNGAVSIAVSPDGATAYVVNSVDSTVSVIDTSTDAVVATVPVGYQPNAVALNAAGTLAYVVNTVGSSVSVINSATDTVVATVPVAANPTQIAVSNPPPSTVTVGQTITRQGNGTVTTAPFSVSGPCLLVAFTAADGSASTQATTVTGAGLTWTRVQRANAKGTGTAEIWTAQASSALSGVTVTSTPKIAGYDQLLTVITVTGTDGAGASAAAGAATGAPGVSLTAAGAGSLVFGVGEDYSKAIARTPGPNQTLVTQWVDNPPRESFWVQQVTTPTPAAGTAITVNDTAPATDTWDLAAVEILSAAA